MFYYIQNKPSNKKQYTTDNDILCFNQDKQVLINTLPFLSHYGRFTKKDIKETEKEMVFFNNKIFFLEDIEQDYLLKEKEYKILNLKQINKDYIYNIYPTTKQIDISLGIYGEELKEELKNFLVTCLNIYSEVKQGIENIKTIQDLRTYDEYREYHNRLMAKEEYY